jgi:hypothetical protein
VGAGATGCVEVVGAGVDEAFVPAFGSFPQPDTARAPRTSATAASERAIPRWPGAAGRT